MEKEDVAHIHRGILLSHKEEQIWDSYSETDEPRACYTVCSTSETDSFLYIKKPQGPRDVPLSFQNLICSSEDGEGGWVRGTKGHRTLFPFPASPFCSFMSRFQAPKTFDMLVPLPGMTFPLDDSLAIFWDSAWTWLSLDKLSDTLCF